MDFTRDLISKEIACLLVSAIPRNTHNLQKNKIRQNVKKFNRQNGAHPEICLTCAENDRRIYEYLQKNTHKRCVPISFFFVFSLVFVAIAVICIECYSNGQNQRATANCTVY